VIVVVRVLNIIISGFFISGKNDIIFGPHICHLAVELFKLQLTIKTYHILKAWHGR
jgi:hypothetical protein